MADNVDSVTILTQNLGGQILDHTQRVQAFVDRTKKLSPDVILVQCCSRVMMEFVIRELGLMKYHKLLSPQMNFRDSREAIFSKSPMQQAKFIPFPNAKDGRGMCVAKIDTWGAQGLWVCTAELDRAVSVRNRTIERHINSMLKFIPLEDPVLFGGDTQILEYQFVEPPPSCNGKAWLDLWYEAGSEDDRYTLDHTRNLLVSPPFKDRPDRFWMRENGHFLCTSLKVVRTEEQEMPISPHYGVKVVLERLGDRP